MRMITNKLVYNLLNRTLISTSIRKLKKSAGIKTKKIQYDRYYGEKAKNYLKDRTHQGKWQKEQLIIQELLSKEPDGITVLDVPLGTGRFVDYYLKKNMTVYGLDISKDMLDAAKYILGSSYDKCDIKIGSADCLPYDDNQFDLIVSCRFFTILSLDMARKVLAEFQRVSKSKAYINIKFKKDTAINNSRWKRWKDSVIYLAGGTPGWVKKKNMKEYISEKELRDTFENFGFKIEDKLTIEEKIDSEYSFFILEKK